MPTVYNGIGTWYYSKKNILKVRQSCEACSHIGDLLSYDTTLYFVFFMIPIFPLKKYRVLDQCPACQRHRIISLKEWEETKNKAMTKALGSLATNPNDNEALMDSLAIATQFQDINLFERIADYAKAEKENPKVQLLLGEAHSYFSQRQEAETAYSHAIRNNPTPEVYRPAAVNAIRMGEPERAQQLLEYITRDKVEDDLGYINLMVDTYQSMGKHEDALALMDKRDIAFPQHATHPEYVKIRKQSEKYQGTGKKLKIANLIDSGKAGASDGNGFNYAMLIFPLILAAFAAWYFYAAFNGAKSQEIYLVNGTQQAYDVAINGSPIKIMPQQHTKTTIPLGEVVVKSPFGDVKQEIQTNFWMRPFSTPMFIFNPDRVALLAEEEVTYSTKPVVNPPPKFMIGEAFYQLKMPYYKFENFPPTVRVKGSTTRTRVGIEPNITPLSLYSIIRNEQQQFGVKSKIELTKHASVAYPEEVFFLSYLSSEMKKNEFSDYLKTKLDDRPLKIQFHRFYLTYDQETSLEEKQKYYKKTDDELKSSESKYLLSLTVDNWDKEVALLEEAVALSPTTIFAISSLSHHYSRKADFATAIKHSENGFLQNPNHFENTSQYLDLLWQSKQFEKFRQISESHRTYRFQSIINLYRSAVVEKNAELQQQYSNRYVEQLRQGKVPNFQELGETTLNIEKAKVESDTSRFIDAVKQREKISTVEKSDSVELFVVHILENKLEQAEELLPKINKHLHAECMGQLSIAYHKADKPDLAKEFALKMIDNTVQTKEIQEVLEMMNGMKPVDIKKIMEQSSGENFQRIYLKVCANMFPKHEKELNELLKKVDYQLDEISLLLKKLK